MRTLKEIVPKPSPHSKPAISFTKAGSVRFSKKLAEEMGLKHGVFVKFYQDEASPLDFFVKVSDEGLPIRVDAANTKYPTFATSNSSICKWMLDQTGMTRYVRCNVSLRSEDGYYLIILKSAVEK